MSDLATAIGRTIHRRPPIHSGHEGYALIREELDELWDAVRRNDLKHACEEAIQIAAMAVRFSVDLGGDGTSG